MLKKGSKVRIKYHQVEKNFRKQLEIAVKKAIFPVDVDTQLKNEINKMKNYDLTHGVIRTVKRVDIAGRFTDHEVYRYTLDNEFVFYKDELIEVEE